MFSKKKYTQANRLFTVIFSFLSFLALCTLSAQRTCGTMLPEELPEHKVKKRPMPMCGMANPIYRLPAMAQRAWDIMNDPASRASKPTGVGYRYWGYCRTEEAKEEQEALCRELDERIARFNSSNEYGLQLPTEPRFWYTVGIDKEDNPWMIMGKIENFLRRAGAWEEFNQPRERNCWKPVQLHLVDDQNENPENLAEDSPDNIDDSNNTDVELSSEVSGAQGFDEGEE